MNEKWELILGDTKRNEMSRIVKADDHEFIIGYLIRESRNKEQQVEDDKRAKLVAAAPDMLAACEEVLSYMPAKANDGPAKSLRAAIAKAKGVK